FQLAPFEPTPAGCLHGVGDLCDARIIAVAGASPRKGTSRGTPDFLSHDRDRWTLHLLQRGRPERRADASHAARISLVIAASLYLPDFPIAITSSRRIT